MNQVPPEILILGVFSARPKGALCPTVQTTEVKQNQTFFHGTNSNLTSFFLGGKIEKYFNDSFN